MLNYLFAVTNSACSGGTNALISPTNLPKTCATSSTLHTVTTIAYVVIAAIAVMLIVIAGLRYIFSQGDPNMVAESKRTIIYTAVGLVIAALATTIVNAVISRL